ncbi:MAG: methyltransferase domain-containing protein [Alphaproteobacteria bacterium]|nr:methyltransferase domain-containing protein [Alphaproteobacteria bacterium]
MSKQHLQKNLKPRDKAALCLLDNDIDTAEEWLEKALEEDENDHAALGMLADVCMLRKEFQEALGLLVLAIAQKPDEKAYLLAFSLCADKLSFSFTQFNAGMAKAVEACLALPELSTDNLCPLWHALLLSHPEVSVIVSPGMLYDSKEKAALTANSLFLSGLKRLIVPNWGFEKALTTLRASLLKDLSSGSHLWERENFLRTAAALSRYCFYTEYIFDTSSEEETLIAAMRQSLSENPAGARAEEIAIFACYESLGRIPAASALAVVCDAETALIPVADLQIREVARLLEIKKDIPCITPIEDSVSGKVREQYEAFPYPRWHHVPHNAVLGEAERSVPQNGSILNAGCGTGYEAALVGTVFPDAEILAVDLSKSSLSYASARAQDLGLSHVKFAQADILQLEGRAERYDYILSSGVLHHMADPFAGWKVLRGLLKPGGLMRIGLYSEIGRSSVVAARKIIQDKGFAATRAGMNEFRQRADKLLPREALEKLRESGDFYQMSTFCDLLFHVQEHRFDLVQIAEILDKLGLDFVGFNLPPRIFKVFEDMHGPAANLADLDQWHALEKVHTEVFSGMYQFWCRAAG